MTMLKVVIVDDEEPARKLLREYLSADVDIQIVAECANGFEAVKAVTDLKPDLLLLDIQMPRLDGFEVLELIGREVDVIFVTAYDKYALRAFEVHAVDYLLKPFSSDRLCEALDHARKRLAAREQLPVRDLAASARSGAKVERVLIRDGSNVHVIPVSKLDYVEAQDDYVCFRSEGKRYLKQQTLGEVETALDPSQFVRIHRSYILNVDRLARLELYAKDSHAAILRDGTRLPVSRSGYARLTAILQ
ncbi:MAG TPA: LytTR family DNA-binding domain-containing protein [Terriglobia bacterium]|nr:LytTR family DNA-binding domain-containing protein [Terriglobia bacterium]